MAEKIVRDPKKAEEPAKKAAGTAKKAAEPAKKAASTAAKTTSQTVKKAEENAKKPQNVITPNKPTGGSTVGLRIGACAMWLLAIVCEVFAIMAIMKYFVPPFGMSPLLFLIIMIVIDMGLCIGAAQLWKKANHINPMSEKRGKFLFYLWNELGVIMACICFIPLIILLLKNDKLDKKTKTIAAIVAAVALLITGVASADFNPISAEQKEEAEQSITQNVYWTQFGHKYHLNIDQESGCPHVRNSTTLYEGSVTEAIEAGRTAICSYCAAHAADWGINLNLEALNVEDKDSVLEEVKDQAPVTTAAGD